MIIGSISENKNIEKRISITPDIAKKYIASGFQILLEAGYGSHLDISDDKFLKEGCKIEKKENILNQSDIVLQLDLPEESNLEIFQENIHLIEKVKLFTNENKLVFDSILSRLKNADQFTINDLSIDGQIIDKIFKFASIKHILNNYQNDHEKIFDLLQEIERDLKNYELELRIEELESKFAKDFNENTFNEIKELKKLQNIN